MSCVGRKYGGLERLDHLLDVNQLVVSFFPRFTDDVNFLTSNNCVLVATAERRNERCGFPASAAIVYWFFADNDQVLAIYSSSSLKRPVIIG